jgi:hypothetical protein
MVVWGDNYWGQGYIPSDLTNVVTVAVGGGHSLALRADGTVVAWGRNDSGQTNVPPDLTNAVAIAAGATHSLAVKADGTVVGWGDDSSGQATAPDGLTNAVSVAGGYSHSLALKTDGTVVVWGNDDYDQTNVPAELSNVVAIAAGDSHNLALKADGTVIGWGWNGEGETDVPADATNVVAIAAGYEHCLALKADGTVVAWGWGGLGQTNVPAGLGNVIAIAAGEGHSLALVNQSVPVILQQPANKTEDPGATVLLRVAAVGAAPLSYQWQKDGFILSEGGNVSGSATANLCLSNIQAADAATYSVIVTNAVGGVTSSPAILTVLSAQVPTLRLERDGNLISIFWSAQLAGFVLESSSSLSPATWADVPDVPVPSGNELMVQIPMSETNSFYRLRSGGP